MPAGVCTDPLYYFSVHTDRQKTDGLQRPSAAVKRPFYEYVVPPLQIWLWSFLNFEERVSRMAKLSSVGISLIPDCR